MAARIASFFQVRPGEARMVGLVSLLFALVEAGRGFGANAADALFFLRFGVDFLPYMFMALGVATCIVILSYTAALGRMHRTRFYIVTFCAFALIVLLERALIFFDWPLLYPVLWITINALSTVLGLQVWQITNEVTDTRQAKRLYAIFMSGGILGSLVGNLLTGRLAQFLGTENLFVLYAALLIGCFWLTWQIARLHFKPISKRTLSVGVFQQLRDGFNYERQSKMLMLMAWASVIFSILYFSISFPFSKVVSASYPNEAAVAGFLGLFSAAATVVTLFVSLVLANRLYAWIGIVNGVLILPLIYLGGFILWAFTFSLFSAVLVRLAQMVILGGLASPAWNALFNVAPPERRGEVLGFDAAVPSQVGVVLSGILLLLGNRILTTTQIFILGMVVSILCAFLIWRMRRVYGEALIEALRAGRFEVFSPSPRAFAGFRGNAQALRVGLNALQDPKPSTRRLAIQILAKMGDQAAVPALLEKLDDPEVEVRGATLCALAELGVYDAANSISALLGDSHPGIRADALEVLTKLQPSATPAFLGMLEQMLNDPAANVSAQAAVALARYGEGPRALAKLHALLCEDLPETRVLALQALQTIAAQGGQGLDPRPIVNAARDPSVAVRRAACETLGHVADSEALDVLAECLDDPDSSVSRAASASLRKLGRGATLRVLHMLRMGRDRAQEAALDALNPNDPSLFEPLRHYADQEVASAQQWRALAAVIPPSGRATKLVHEVLETRAEQSELRLVKTVGLLGHPEAMEVVAKSLKSRGKENRAEAVEALETLGDKRLAQQIIPLLEENPEARYLSPADALAQLLGQKEVWLRALAARAAGELQLRGLIPNLNVIVERDPETLPREAAYAALVELNEIPPVARPDSIRAPFTDALLNPPVARAAHVREEVSGEAVPMETLRTVSSLERVLLVREVPLFAELSPEDLKQIAEVAREQLYPDGAVICREGDEGNEMYIIASGQVKVTKQVNGAEKFLARRGVGEFIGEMAIIEAAARSATVRAEGNVRTLVIDAPAFKSILRDRPEVSLAVLRGLSRRLRERD